VRIRQIQPLSVNTVRSRVMGTNMHGTIRPQRRQQIDCICGSLSHRRRNRRNRYFDSSQARIIATVIVACGTSALARKHATAGHRLKVNNFVSVK